LFYSGKASFILKNIRNFSYTISIAIKWSKLFGHINSANKSDFYSVWNDDAALLLSILRSKNKIQNFSIRLHGYDLFDERRSGGYMPYRYFIFKMAKHIFVLSKAGYSYIRQKKVFEEKLILNYSGIYDRGINPAVEEGKITMVSCSNLIPIKRVHKIVEALSLLEFQVDWYHFGEGPERANIENEIVNLPKHIHAKLMGHIENDKLLEFYSRVPIQLFIHLSETEGLGMALVEAQSFGIPVLACDVGGVSEVVDNELGILIPVDSDARSISNEISLFIASNRGNQVFRDKVRKKCLETFGAEHNYKYFYTMLSSEKS